jgi:hypothetical protein
MKKTTRMETMEREFNLTFENGRAIYHSKVNGKKLIDVRLQDIEYLKNGYCVVRKNSVEKEIFSFARETYIKKISTNAQVMIITESRQLIGLLITDFNGQEVINLDGKTIYYAKKEEALLQPTELLGSRVVYIKKIEPSGRKTFITFDGNELEIPTEVKMDFQEVNGEIFIVLTNDETQKWYNSKFRKVVELKNGYAVKAFHKMTEEIYGKTNPCIGPLETRKVINYDSSDNEYRTSMVYYPAGLTQKLVVEEYEKLLNDESNKVAYHIRPTHGRVELYRYNTGSNVTFMEHLGYTHINLLPNLEVV